MTPSREETAFKGFLCNVILFALALGVYRWSNYYAQFLDVHTQTILLWLFGAYVLLGFPLALSHGEETKGLRLFRIMSRSLRPLLSRLREYPLEKSLSPLISHEDRTAILFLLVKFYFTPIMIHFMVGNAGDTLTHWHELKQGSFTGATLFIQGWYPILFSAFFLIDTTFFVFGYLFEHPFLKNTVRSVEPTFFGWVVALLCYPPFNQVPDFFFAWPATDFPVLNSVSFTLLLRIIILLLLALYVWATLALGTRCSNLTNRGIVSWGPYRFVRHPAYIAKNCAWWLSALPFLAIPENTIPGIIGMSAWTLLYFFRALTEERHLSQDPEYMAYCASVQYRFIPHVF